MVDCAWSNPADEDHGGELIYKAEAEAKLARYFELVNCLGGTSSYLTPKERAKAILHDVTIVTTDAELAEIESLAAEIYETAKEDNARIIAAATWGFSKGYRDGYKDREL